MFVVDYACVGFCVLQAMKDIYVCAILTVKPRVTNASLTGIFLLLQPLRKLFGSLLWIFHEVVM